VWAKSVLLTILKLLALAGEKSQALLDAYVCNLRPKYVQLDELWTFVHTKEGTFPRTPLPDGATPTLGLPWTQRRSS
jgi:hypothetical protein